MRPAHRSAGRSPGSKSPSRGSPESRTVRSHCAHLSSRCVPSPAACTRTGSPDRNTCTACRNEAQIRTSGTFHRLASPAARCRTAHNARRPAFQANLPVADQVRDPILAGRSFVPQAASEAPDSAVHDRDPDNPVDGISPQSPPPSVCAVLSTRYCPWGKWSRTNQGHGSTPINTDIKRKF